MKTLLLLLFLFAACVTFAVSQSGRRINTTRAAPVQPPLNPEPEVRQPKPAAAALTFLPEKLLAHKIQPLEGKSFRLSDFQGKVVVINLWASWCGPCRREVPEYEKVRRAYTNGDVVFIGLTMEDPRYENERVQRFVREVGFTFRMGWADGELARALTDGRRSIPQTLVINQEGRIVSHWDGYSPGRSGPRLKQTIDQALARE